MSEKRLLDPVIRGAKPAIGPRTGKPAPYALNDGAGLFVMVHPNGKKYFQFRYTFGKRQRLMQLGRYPRISLTRARELAQECRDVLAKGDDPGIARRLTKARTVLDSANTFSVVAKKYLAHNAADWCASNLKRKTGLLRLHVEPKIGMLPVKDITGSLVLDEVLVPLQDQDKLQTTRQVLQTVAAVFNFAITNVRVISANPCDKLSTALRKPRPDKHHAALAFDQIGEFLHKLADSDTDPVTKAALRLFLLLGMRDTSLLSAQWKEIDFEGATWTAPAQHMKGKLHAKQEFISPLPKQALAVLKRLYPVTYRGADSLVFASYGKSGRLSITAPNAAIKRLGFDATPHGFRSLLRTYLTECQFPVEWIKSQLAQTIGSKVDQAYLRSSFFVQRATMMAFWADTLDALDKGKPLPLVRTDNVIRIKRAA